MIRTVKARMIYDSRGNPTVEVALTTDTATYISSCPSGASTGASEAVELRDGGPAHHGKGVESAIKNIHTVIAPALAGKFEETDQAGIDALMLELDGTDNKGRLGANAILPVSMAACRAAAGAKQLPLWNYLAELSGRKPEDCRLPLPCFNIINGGEHAGNLICIQEFMIAPVGARTFAEAMQMASETYHTLRGILRKKFGIEAVNVGDEGGFAPSFADSDAGRAAIRTALALIEEAIGAAGYKGRIKVGMDCAATSFWDGQATYDLDYKGAKPDKIASGPLVAFYKELVRDFPVVFLEDPLGEEDWAGFAQATAELGVPIIGDDLLTTNPARIRKALELKACNALLLKVNQIGTVSEAVEAAKMAGAHGWKVMTSHRSGETADDFIADLAVGLGTPLIKSGAPCRGERLAKYNRLLEIEAAANLPFRVDL